MHMLMQLWRKPTQHLPSLTKTLFGAAEMSNRWLMLPTSCQLWNWLHQCWTYTLSATPTKFKWFSAGVSAMLLATLIAPLSCVTSLLSSLNCTSLEERRRQDHLAVMYHVLHNQVDIYWQSFLIKASSCSRGHSCRLCTIL